MVLKMNFKPTRSLRFIIRNVYVGKYFFYFFLIVLTSFTLVVLLCFNFQFQSLGDSFHLKKPCIFFGAALTMFLGITFPFFGGLLSFFGGFAFAPTTYFVWHNISVFLKQEI
jgi:hypothetical protein